LRQHEECPERQVRRDQSSHARNITLPA
jgi:hypothetical protein